MSMLLKARRSLTSPSATHIRFRSITRMAKWEVDEWEVRRMPHITRYRIFHGQQVKAMNATLPKGAKLYMSADSYMHRLTIERWKAMSPEERNAATEKEYQKQLVYMV